LPARGKVGRQCGPQIVEPRKHLRRHFEGEPVCDSSRTDRACARRVSKSRSIGTITVSVYPYPVRPKLYMRGSRTGSVRNMSPSISRRSWRSSRSTGSIWSLAAFHLPTRGLPEFRLFPKTIGHTVLWGEDPYVRFDEPPEFSQRFLAHRAEEEAVRNLLTIDVRRALCDLDGWTVEGKGDWVISFCSQRLLAPRDLPDFLATARRIVGCFKEHLA